MASGGMTKRFGFSEDEHTEILPDRIVRDRADTVRIAPPSSHPFPAYVLTTLVVAGVMLGSIVALVH
jgi:hypothetical protein